jgi:uncharacterized membrane protein
MGPSAPFSPGDSVSFAWERVKADPGTILATVIVGFLAIGALQFAINLVTQLVVGIGVGVSSSAMSSHHAAASAALGPMFWVMTVFGQLVSVLVSSFFVAGISKFCIKVARGEPYSFNDLFGAAPVFLSVLAANLLLALVVSVGFLLLIVPGVIAALGLMLTVPLIVDRGLGPIEALQASWKLTDGHKGNLFVAAILWMALSVGGLCACFVGVLVVMPLVYIAQMYIYLKLSGQPVARVGPAA